MTGPAIGKWIIFAGCLLIGLGLLIWLGSKWGVPFGKLPGDIAVQKEKMRFYFPLATSLIISLILTIFVNLIFWIFRR
jgi:hypothetical protein